MRKMMQMLRFAGGGVSAGEIGGSLGVARSTIKDNLKRAAVAGVAGHVWYLCFGQFSLGRHPCPLVFNEGLDARGTDPNENAGPPQKPGRKLIGMPAGFISEWWPASNRNRGRLHVGIPGRNKSESAPQMTFAKTSV